MKDLWVPVSAAIAQQRKVETIANNIANANTPGFKKDDIVFKEHLVAMEKGLENIDLPRKEWKPEDFYRHQGAENSYVNVDGTYTIHNQGSLTPTHAPLDVAIKGKGFFEVLTPNGIRYTRKGTFSVSKDGDLVTDNGHKVLSSLDFALLSQGGDKSAFKAPTPEERVIKITAGKVAIDAKGNVLLNNNAVGQLSVVEFKNNDRLTKEGASLFANSNNKNIEEGSRSTVLQGFVELSNVNPIYEMSELIKANRNFESVQRVIKAYDSMAQKGVSEIAKF